MVMHTGGWAGFITYFMRAIEDDKCIILLTNNSTSYYGNNGIRAGLTKILFDQPYQLPPLSIREVMGKTVFDSGAEHAVEQYKKFKTERPAEFLFAEEELNLLGYELLWADRVDDAVAILRLNVEEYPLSANVYDSYGDALLAKDDTVNALENFKKAFAMDATMLVTKEKVDGIEKEEGPKEK